MKKGLGYKVTAVVFSAIMALQLLPMQAFAAKAENMLKNGGFEEGDASWAGISDNEIDTAEAHTGKQSLHLVRGIMSPNRVSQTIGAVIEGEYTFSGYVKGQGYHATFWYGVALNIEVHDLNGNYLKTVTTGNIDQADNWEKHAVTVDVPKEGAILTAVITIMSPLTGQICDFHVDDLAFEKDPPKPPPVPVNLLKNSGFESGINNWIQRGETPCAFSTDAQSKSGKNSICFGYFTSEPLVNYIEQTVPVSASGWYEFSAYIKTDSTLAGVGATLFIEARDGAGAVVASENSASLANSQGQWEKCSVQLNVPKTTKTITVKLGGIYNKGAFYADDLSLLKLTGV